MSVNAQDPPPPPRLLSVGRLLERGVDLDIILSAIVDDVVDRLAAERGTLYLVDPNAGEILSKAAHLPELNEIRLPLGKGIAGLVAQQNSVVRLDSPYDDKRFDRSVDSVTGFTTTSMIVAPITDSEEAVIGVLQVLNSHSGAFSDSDEAALLQLCAQAGQVLEKTSLYAQLRRRTEPSHAVEYRYNFIVGTSPAMREVYTLMHKAAQTDATVLLRGESGTGKGLIASAIHVNSPRGDAPFITLDCTTLPPSLIENELFGHERGAYTGAHKRSIGRLEQAHGGTLFIDEIGELTPALQTRLLRVIQEREFVRVGGSETIKVDFRLLTATHRDLEDMVANGGFRADLFYRICVVPMHLPALRERGAEDIERLAEHFLEHFTKKHRRQHPHSAVRLSASAHQRLLAHHWPGNIRELENCIESALVLTDGDIIEGHHLPLAGGRGERGAAPVTTEPARTVESQATGDALTLAEIERQHIEMVLSQCEGNQSDAARRLDISRNTLARKLKSYKS